MTPPVVFFFWQRMLIAVVVASWGNNDGVDFESGERIRVLDSTFIMGDDG